MNKTFTQHPTTRKLIIADELLARISWFLAEGDLSEYSPQNQLSQHEVHLFLVELIGDKFLEALGLRGFFGSEGMKTQCRSKKTRRQKNESPAAENGRAQQGFRRKGK